MRPKGVNFVFGPPDDASSLRLACRTFQGVVPTGDEMARNYPPSN
jgi:hypothetical protein